MRIGQRFNYQAACLICFLLGTMLPLLASAAPIEVWHYTVVPSDPPNPGSGWGMVTQLLTGSGCDGTGCGSTWRPRNDSYTILLENAGDRINKAHDSGDGSPPYNATLVYRRQICPTDGAWAAGTWHHNFQARSSLQQTNFRIVQNGGQTVYYITLAQRWGSGYYQSFAHDDPCFAADPLPQVTPTPPIGGGSDATPTVPPGQPTPPPPPTPTDVPTPLPVNPCTGGGPPIPDPSYSLWTASGLATTAPGPVLSTTVALAFQQTPIGFGRDLKAWKEQTLLLEGPVTGRLIWSFDEGTDHGNTVRELRNNDRRRSTFTRPAPGRFRLLWGGHPNQPSIQFTTRLDQLPAGAYRIISHTQNSACTPRFAERTFYFQVDGALPPPLPAPTAGLFGWARSPHDSTPMFATTSDNPDSMHLAWAYGGIMEFYPDVTLTLPTAPAYRVVSTITGWHFRGSPPLDAAPINRTLAYRQPIRILWSKYPPPELRPPDVNAYHITQVDAPVTIAVTLDYTYQIYDTAGAPVGLPLNGSIEGQFTVALVYPQVLDGGHP